MSNAEKPLKILADAFRYPIERIIPTGYPRNDIFFSKDKNLKEKLRIKYNIPEYYKRVILYAPTFRDNFIAKFPLNNQQLIELNELMKNTNSLFLMKAHMKEKIIDFKNLKNIRTIGKNSDTQELLLFTDILISDYSSIYCDFLLLNRPILLFPYDYDEYVKERGLYYDYLEEIAPGPIIHTAEELIHAIENISDIEKQFNSKRLELRNYFNAYIDGNSSERLIKYLKLKL